MASTGSTFGGHFTSSSTGGVGVFGRAAASTGTVIGGSFQADSNKGIGVYGNVAPGNGITGVYGQAGASGTNYGVFGRTSSSTGYGVYSAGRFAASGTKSFQIDHPLDPENQYLNHYCAEGPEPLNVYRGNVTLDNHGEAWVALPDYFAEINRDPSYQLTPVGGAAPKLHIAQPIANNRFLIAGGAPGLVVSWRVEAVRNDLFVQTYGAPVEVQKPEPLRGSFVHPELYGQPVERGQLYVAPDGQGAEAPIATDDSIGMGSSAQERE
ncbi:MAG: hypothetical protein IT449_02785 [Phycisphaerales bacterium]|nr:hypothetical protein [Phycisphaerales bacterium]